MNEWKPTLLEKLFKPWIIVRRIREQMQHQAQELEFANKQLQEANDLSKRQSEIIDAQVRLREQQEPPREPDIRDDIMDAFAEIERTDQRVATILVNAQAYAEIRRLGRDLFDPVTSRELLSQGIMGNLFGAEVQFDNTVERFVCVSEQNDTNSVIDKDVETESLEQKPPKVDKYCFLRKEEQNAS